MNNRRKLVIALGASALVAPFYSYAQQQKDYRIGVLMSGSSATVSSRVDDFIQALAKLGYIEGNNLSLTIRYADGNNDRLPMLASELVTKNVAVIFAQDTPASRAAKQATGNIPIVFAGVGDPVGSGIVASLSKPGGNITGLSIIAPELAAKRLQILRELFPKISRLVIIPGGAQPGQIAEAERGAKALGMQVLLVQLESREDLKKVVTQLKEWRADSLNFLAGSINLYNQKLLGELAATTRLPAVSGEKDYAEAGALFSYGADIRSRYFRAATYVDKILKGAKPADLPVEQPTNFELIINMKTAKALGVKIPNSILVQATHVIE